MKVPPSLGSVVGSISPLVADCLVFGSGKRRNIVVHAKRPEHTENQMLVEMLRVAGD